MKINLQIKNKRTIFALNKRDSIMIRIVTLNTNRSEYDIRDAAASSMTVGELIDELECNYNRDDKIVLSNDNGYTYGYIGAGYIDAHRVETHEEEDRRESMEAIKDELEDLRERYLEPDEDEEPMTEEEYKIERQKIFDSYDITEEEFNKFTF